MLPLSVSARLPWASELCLDGPVKQQPDSRRTGKRAVAGSKTWHRPVFSPPPDTRGKPSSRWTLLCRLASWSKLSSKLEYSEACRRGHSRQLDRGDLSSHGGGGTYHLIGLILYRGQLRAAVGALLQILKTQTGVRTSMLGGGVVLRWCIPHLRVQAANLDELKGELALPQRHKSVLKGRRERRTVS